MAAQDDLVASARRAEQEMIRRRKSAAARWPKLLEEIRQLPGFSGFALPPPIAGMREAAGEGTVVSLIVTDHGCGALLLTRDSVDYLELDGLTAQAAFDNANAFLHAVNPGPKRSVDPEAMRRVLVWLWEAVTGPVLDKLGHGPCTADPYIPGGWPRVWWIPTGPLSVLPIHAAGNGAPGQSVLDRVVSSYTPSVRALGDARKATAGRVPGSNRLIVGINQVADQDVSPLIRAEEEARRVHARLGGAAPLLGSRATHQQVKDRLPGVAWAHFACHGLANNADPVQSFLALYDRALTAGELFTMQLKDPYLAFLSACSTGVPSPRLVDESIHLASAFQLAGFPHVVATLWRINDWAAADLAPDFYAAVHPSTHGFSPPAQALHATIRAYRDKPAYRDNPQVWASHVHFGP